MDNTLDSMLEAYLFEANELTEHLEEILIKCEKENKFDTDSINEIFRIMHTIKGSSAMMQFQSLTTIAHKVEDLFYFVRENGIDDSYNEELFDLVFRSSDFIKAELEKVENNQPLTTDIGTFEEEINDFLKKISGKSNDKPENAPSSAAAGKAEKSASDAENKPAAADDKLSAASGYSYAVKVFFDEEAQMENLRAFMLVNNLSEIYTDFTYTPKDIQTDSATAEEIIKNGFLISFKSKADLNGAVELIENFMYTKNYTVLNTPIQQKEKNTEEINKELKKTVKEDTSSPSHFSAKQNLINVNLSKLDSLMDLMGEIVITESMVTSIPGNANIGIDNNFSKATRQLRKLTDELQEIVMSIRMVPIAGAFQKMNRIVRDMSKKLNKDVDLVLVGEETEVDKTIVDNIGDPLMHVVRNSMDHGIEDKETRVQAGKPEKGRVTLTAQNTGGEILITIEDDGQGINRESVLKKAKKQGLLKKPESEYSARDVNSLLMVPGFSTNETVTEYSGRGVGMDVVKKNIEKIGGDVTIDSEYGKGTKVLFKIPLTLAIVNGMKIMVGETVFTIPINNIRQSFKVTESSILHDTNGNEIINVRNQYYPVVRLHSVFDIPTEITDISSGIVILVETHDKSYCVFADSLIGEQQVVLKPMPAYLNQFDIKKTGVSGCAILGDGSISLILDILNLYNNN